MELLFHISSPVGSPTKDTEFDESVLALKLNAPKLLKFVLSFPIKVNDGENKSSVPPIKNK